MKILFCLGSLDKGGTQRVVTNLSNHLVNENEIIILTTSDNASQYELDQRIKRIALDENKKNNNIKRIIKLNSILKKHKPDVILTFQPEPSFRMLILRKLRKIPMILSVRNDPNTEYRSFKRKTSFTWI